MGSDGGNKPHPAAKNPRAPCDEAPSRPGWNDILPNQYRPRPHIIARHQQPQQVRESEGYAVAGKLLLAAAGALAGVLLALVALYLYNSARRRRLGLGGGGRRLDRSLAIIIAGGGEDRHDSAAAPSPRGLDPAVLRALPVVAAGAGAGDCAVCLAELEPGEKSRALPRCGHRFHAECIDAWFRGNATCPLCRADVVAPDAAADEAVPSAPPEVRVDVAGLDAAAAAAKEPAMGRLPSGTDLDKTRRVFASTRSVSF